MKSIHTRYSVYSREIAWMGKSLSCSHGNRENREEDRDCRENRENGEKGDKNSTYPPTYRRILSSTITRNPPTITSHHITSHHTTSPIELSLHTSCSRVWCRVVRLSVCWPTPEFRSAPSLGEKPAINWRVDRPGNNHGESIPGNPRAVDESTTTMERLGLLLEPTMLPITTIPKQEGMSPLLYDEGWKGVEGKRSRRGLQTSCAEGDPFTITSSAFPSLEGCLLSSGFVTADGNLVYNSSTVAILSNTTTDGSAEAHWVVYEIIDGVSWDSRCFSNETSIALPYPVEATWICDVDDDGVFDEFPTASQFSTSCGCSSTTASPTDTGTTSTTESGSTTCNEGESFTITSTVVPEVVGCYSDTGELLENEVIYSETGTEEVGQNFVGAGNIGEDSAQDIRWIVGYVSSDTTSREDELYCFSTDMASSVHPADVTSWACDLGGETSDFLLLPGTSFAITCGCTLITTSSPTTPGSEQNANVGHLSTTLSAIVTVGVCFTAMVVHLVRL